MPLQSPDIRFIYRGTVRRTRGKCIPHSCHRAVPGMSITSPLLNPDKVPQREFRQACTYQLYHENDFPKPTWHDERHETPNCASWNKHEPKTLSPPLPRTFLERRVLPPVSTERRRAEFHHASRFSSKALREIIIANLSL